MSARRRTRTLNNNTTKHEGLPEHMRPGAIAEPGMNGGSSDDDQDIRGDMTTTAHDDYGEETPNAHMVERNRRAAEYATVQQQLDRLLLAEQQQLPSSGHADNNPSSNHRRRTEEEAAQIQDLQTRLNELALADTTTTPMLQASLVAPPPPLVQATPMHEPHAMVSVFCKNSCRVDGSVVAAFVLLAVTILGISLGLLSGGGGDNNNPSGGGPDSVRNPVPSLAPVAEPSPVPSPHPSHEPATAPTPDGVVPLPAPTTMPVNMTDAPTPAVVATVVPTKAPMANTVLVPPTRPPTISPTLQPTVAITTLAPTLVPTAKPVATATPTPAPTTSTPTTQPTTLQVAPTNRPVVDTTTFDYEFRLRDLFVHGENLMETKSLDANSESACLDFCRHDSFAARYAASASGASCVCYNHAVDCLIPWGNQVNEFTIAFGSVFTKQPVPQCTFDWCTANPDHWYCFTNQRVQFWDVGVYADNLQVSKSTQANSEQDCLQFCQAHFAVRYASSSAEGPSCVCYDDVECLVPWGAQVNVVSSIAYGSIFSKQPVARCSFDWCEKHPDDWMCFTARKVSLSDVTVYGDNLKEVKSQGVSSEIECLQFCQGSPVVRHRSFSSAGDSCVCYDAVDCLQPWGDQVNTNSIAFGYIFMTTDIGRCTSDWCDTNPDNWLCFTARKANHKDATVYGDNLVQIKSTDASSEKDCLQFCEGSFAVRYIPYDSSVGDSCACYNAVDCLIQWGDQVEPNSVAFGYIFTREQVSFCSFDYCTKFPGDALCSTR